MARCFILGALLVLRGISPSLPSPNATKYTSNLGRKSDLGLNHCGHTCNYIHLPQIPCFPASGGGWEGAKFHPNNAFSNFSLAFMREAPTNGKMIRFDSSLIFLYTKHNETVGR